MDDALATVYRSADYRVRLARGGHASVRIGHPLPEPLQALAGDAPACVITAWNPASRLQSGCVNRQALRILLADLKRCPATRSIVPAVGWGNDGWFERSLFAVGPDSDICRHLCQRHGQYACVVCPAGGVAELCWASAPERGA